MEVNKEELQERLSEEAFNVTQNGATEHPFTGKYYELKDDGMYHCIVCGAELFNSETKFDSKTGWPSFYDVANKGAVEIKTDTTMGMARDEVLCKNCGAHLGHVFEDATDTPTGQRYCINSCALDLKKKDES